MCGICGVVNLDPSAVFSEADLVRMRDTLSHRGPDDSGLYLSDQAALGSRRLAILDLSPNGHMPMCTPDGRYIIVYNGEVYNYQDFRHELEAKGYQFRSNSDTETLLYLYAEYGPHMLDRLIGMFAIAIWDDTTKTLFLARDRLGIKPLVYAQQGNRLLFASEEKALHAAGIAPVFDEDCWDELLYFRYISGENTVFRGIQNLLPGHYLLWRNGSPQIVRYWHLQERVEAIRGGTPDVASWFRDTLESSIRYRLISDVPVGVLLSGGLDSSTVATLSGQFSSHISSFTVRFQEEFHDEGPYAKEVADRNGLEYHELFVKPREELPLLVGEASRFQDAPLAHSSSAHILAVSRFAKSHVTVLLSGEGGDETLGGYVRYQILQQPPSLLALLHMTLPVVNGLFPRSSRLIGPRLRKLQRFLRQGRGDDLILFNSCEVLPVDFADLNLPRSATPNLGHRRQVLSEAKSLYPGDPLRMAMYLDQHTFLQSLLMRNDRMTMGASIECRVPFLDHRLVEGLAAIPTDKLTSRRKNKALLRDCFGPRLPNSILAHRKVGFGVPWAEYMRDPKALGRNMENLASSPILESSPIPKKSVQQMVCGFLRGDNRNYLLLHQLLMVAIWHSSQ